MTNPMATVLQWVKRLEDKLQKQKEYAEPYELRYCNEFVLPFIAREYKEVYGTEVDLFAATIRAPQSGMAAIPIDALTERLTLDGASADDTDTTRKLMEAWEDNDLDVMHREATREALIKSRSFGTVSPAQDGSRAIVSIDSSEQVAVHRETVAPYDVDVRLKIQEDEWTGQRIGQLLYRDETSGKVYSSDLTEANDPKPDPEGSDVVTKWRAGEPKQLKFTGVPCVEFAPKARLLKEPVSEIAHIVTLVDLADLVEGLMVFAGHFGAVPIRWATGLEVPRDPKDPSKPLLGPDGKPMVGFKPRADHFWSNSNAAAKFGQLEPAGLASFVAWADHVSSQIRSKSSIPSTYFALDLKTHMSAELLKTDEAPMVRRVNGMGQKGSLNQSWRRLNGWILQVEAPNYTGRVKPRWVDPNTRVEAQAMDSFQKAAAAGMGLAASAEQLLGWSPEVIAEAVAEGERQRQQLAGVDVGPAAREILKTAGIPGAPEPLAVA